jgi:hypothetical protein
MKARGAEVEGDEEMNRKRKRKETVTAQQNKIE